jgi:predicted RNase H-like HicB family nuclease
MIVEYCKKAIETAIYKQLSDGTWFGEIPGFQGVWANGQSIDKCREELMEVLEEWLFLKLKDGNLIPEIDGLQIEFRQFAAA